MGRAGVNAYERKRTPLMEIRRGRGPFGSMPSKATFLSSTSLARPARAKA